MQHTGVTTPSKSEIGKLVNKINLLTRAITSDSSNSRYGVTCLGVPHVADTHEVPTGSVHNAGPHPAVPRPRVARPQQPGQWWHDGRN